MSINGCIYFLDEDDVLCMLPNNKFNLFYITLGFWIVILSAFTILDFIYQIFKIFYIPRLRENKIRNGDFGDYFIIAQIFKNLKFNASKVLSTNLNELNFYVQTE